MHPVPPTTTASHRGLHRLRLAAIAGMALAAMMLAACWPDGVVPERDLGAAQRALDGSQGAKDAAAPCPTGTSNCATPAAVAPAPAGVT